MGKFSFVGDLASTVSKNAKTAKEVMESTGKSANKNATMIKNCINSVQSNMSSGQAKAVTEMGVSSSRALKKGIDDAASQVKAKTAQKALDNYTSYQGNSAVQKSKEFIDSKRTNQVIDGHNAQSRATAMETINNKVKNNNANRVPKDHEAARSSINKANETMRQNREKQFEDIRKFRRFGNSESTAHIEPKNVDTQELFVKAMQKNDGSIPSDYKYDNLTRQSPWSKQTADAGSSGSGGNRNTTGGPNNNKSNNKNSKTKERMNRDFNKEEFNEKFGEFGEQAKDTLFGGIHDTYDNIRNGEQGIFEAIGNAHKNDDGSVNWRRAAGTFVTASAAARVASGGGVYKDRYGNPNLIGVPFI